MALVGYRYSTLPATLIPPPRVHPLPLHPGTPPSWAYCSAVRTRSNMVVGLISVTQLTLGAQISGFHTITEVYNLVRIGRIINH